MRKIVLFTFLVISVCGCKKDKSPDLPDNIIVHSLWEQLGLIYNQEKILLSSVYFINADTGFIVGSKLNTPSSGDSAMILKTNNGGTTWTIFYLPYITVNHLNSVLFTDAKTGYAAGLRNYPTWYSSYGAVFKTIDCGTTWTEQFFVDLPVNLISGSGLKSIYFNDTDTGYAAGSKCIVKTVNGGGSWTVTDFSFPYGTLLESVYFTDVNTGYAVGLKRDMSPIYGAWGKVFSVILKTKNGGTTWTEQNVALEGWLNSVYFTDTDTGYAVGGRGSSLAYGQGVILKTTDGGDKWLVSGIFEAKTAEFYSVYFADSETGYAVGRYGIIVKTINAGNSWKIINDPELTSPFLRSVYFTDPNTGYVVGDYSTILKTTTGGE